MKAIKGRFSRGGGLSLGQEKKGFLLQRQQGKQLSSEEGNEGRRVGKKSKGRVKWRPEFRTLPVRRTIKRLKARERGRKCFWSVCAPDLLFVASCSFDVADCNYTNVEGEDT